MADYTQAKRPLSITTPLGKDVLLLAGFKGQEAMSQMFRFQVELLANLDANVAFDAILGQGVTVELVNADQSKRHFHGIVQRFTSGQRDDQFAHYRADIVPTLWLLSKRTDSRIFQHQPVPDILKKVLVGFDVKWEIGGSYYPRDYCVQYRESDFAFASRLMEEEGIYYFFKHSDGNHTMVVTDFPSQHPDVPGQASMPFDPVLGGKRDDMRVYGWEKSQELRSAKYTLWDHCFELPNKNLEAQQQILETVAAGRVTHHLKVGANAPLEVYEYPGGYARRFDGVDSGGGDRPPDLEEIFKDNLRTAKIRMEQEALPSLEVQAASNGGHFSAGHKFTLTRHPDADGAYALTRVEHNARFDHYRSDRDEAFSYQNRFVAIPAALPYRPARLTPRPIIAGTQTATVVGPPGEEIFVDKYGRIKVQFHWDREGKKDLGSSCWLRVAQVWAGKRWGAFFWPRIGHEVVVAFEDGDPDQPLIIGSVYNTENMPPCQLPVDKELGGIKSASLRGSAHQNFNGVVFIDEKGREHLEIHSERHLTFNSELDKLFQAGRNKVERVSGVSLFTVGSIPGGGGSGGGPDPYDPWPPPQTTAMLGMNGMMVYGENLQFATGLNHQAAIGSNLQVCINPFSLIEGAGGSPDPSLAQCLGSGFGGNMQLTIGTSASFVLGRAFDINLGPRKFEVKAGGSIEHPTTILLCRILGAIYIVWSICYSISLLDSNKSRSFMVLISQTAIIATLILIISTEYRYKQAQLFADMAEATAHGDRAAWDAANSEWKELMPGPPMVQAPMQGAAPPESHTGEELGMALAILLALVTAGILPAVGEVVTAEREKNP